MTSKEAKKILNEHRNRNYNSANKDEVELAKAIDVVLPKFVELESRDTPMKPKPSKNTSAISKHCICDNVVMPYDKFCPKCGQRLDWSDL